MLVDQTVKAYLEDLASSKPAPGGGSAAALAGALGAALASMVANLTLGREKFRAVESEMQSLLEATNQLRLELSDLIDLDAEVYEQVSAAYRLPKGTDLEKQARSEAIQVALTRATDVPLSIARACGEILRLAPIAARAGNPNVVTDAGAAAILAQAGLEAALLNVDVNLATLRAADYVERGKAEVERLRVEAQQARAETDAIVRRVLGG